MLIFLLECGADPNMEDNSGYAAIDYCGHNGYIREVLREYGSREPYKDVLVYSDSDYENESNSEYENDYPDTESEGDYEVEYGFEGGFEGDSDS